MDTHPDAAVEIEALTNEQVLRAADEGVPIAALRRIFRTEPEFLRGRLRTAVASGRLAEMPGEDWPPAVPRRHRSPSVQPHELGEDDSEIILKMAKAFKTTKLESRVLLVILRRGMTSREQLHIAVEDNRGNPADPTDLKIVDVVICKLRKKLSTNGLVLHTIHSMGYEMSEEDRAKAWKMINTGAVS